MKQLSLIPIIIILMQSIGWGSAPAVTSAPAATPTPAVSAPHVIGGDPSSDVTSIGGYAGIRVTYTKNGVAAAGFCNGVLVDSEWVLTAAYCMYPAGVNITSQPANVRVELGCFRNLNNVCSSGTLMLYGQPRQPAIVARQIVVHDQLTINDGVPQPAYGVALIRLSTPAQTGAGVNVWTVAQSSDNPTAESSPYIVSYGNKGLKATATATRTLTASRTPLIPSRTPTNIMRTATQTRTSTATAWPEGIATSDVLKASIALINDSSCTLPGFSGATLWCANATAQGNELCYGDTGAPLVSKVSGQLAVFGISLPKVQFGGAHNCVMGMQSAMVDVTAPAIRTWIVNTIRATSPRGLNTSLGGSAGFGGEQLAPSDNDMTQVDVSSVFPSGIRIGTTVTNILSVNANGVVALGSVTKLDKVINPTTYTGAPLFMVFGADADPSLGEIKASVGGKSSGANRVWVAKDAVNGVVTITWDDVRPARGILLEQYIGNTFQVQFRRENTSDVRVTYRYGMLQWTFSETMCSLPGCLGSGNRVSFAQVGYVSGKAKGVGNLMHVVAGKDAMLRTLVAHEYVIRDGMIGPERPTATSSSTRTMTRTSTPTRTQTPTRTTTASMTPTASATSATTPTSTPLAQGLTDGLLAWYPLNGIRTTGSTLPVQANTIMGAAQYFDGVNDYHQTTVDLANKSFTVAFWAAHDGIPGLAIGTRSMAIGAGSDADRYKAFQVFFTGKYILCSNYDSVAVFDAPNTFDVTEWHHYACIYNISTTTVDLVVDGVFVASGTFSQPLQTTSSFWIGRPPWNYDYFKGTLRDVMVYNRALTSSEINRIKDITPNSVMLSEPHPASACRWVDKGGMVHEYEINHDLLTWDQAKAAAEARTRGGQQGYLATITSAAENECIAQLMGIHAGGQGAWFGGKRVSAGGLFIWQGGPEKGMNIAASTGYEKWNPGEPSNTSGNEDALYFINADNKQWNDTASYAYNVPSIIEYTYPESHTISGVAYTDTNTNNQLDAGDFRAANQTITLTADLAQPIDIVGGGNQMCARLDDGRAVCWGRRGDSWRWDQQSAVPIEVNDWRDVRAISNGFLTSCALLANGTVSCLSKNSNGAVGDGSTTDRWTPVLVSGITNAVALNSGGGNHHCAVLANGTVNCWGDNTYAQIGDGTYDSRRITPATVSGLSGVVQVSVGERHTCARKGDGTVWCWGHVFHGEAGWVATGATTTRRSSAVQLTSLSNITQVALSKESACGRRANGDVLCWGEANLGQLGDGTYQPRGIANYVRVTWQTNPHAARVAKIISSERYRCAILTDRRVACWGSKHPYWSTNPETTLEPGIINGLMDVVDVITSLGNHCALKRDGTVWCWGDRMVADQFINGVLTTNIPQLHKQRNVIALSAGYKNSVRCLTAATGLVTCYKNDTPVTGDGAFQLPTGNVIGGDVGAISHGIYSSCYIKQSNGEVWCWGDNTNFSQLGIGVSNIQTSVPQKVVGLTNIQQITTSDFSTCALKADTSVSCWGNALRIDGVNGGG